MKYILKRNENLLIGGTVVEEVTGENGKASLTIRIDNADGTGENVQVFVNDYLDSDRPNKSGTNLLKFNPKKGRFITFYGKEGKKAGQFYASGWRANGRWKFPKKDELPENNVLIGVIYANKTQSNESHYSVSMPVTISENETVWHHITLVNHENRKLADNMRKCVNPGENAIGYVICGEEREWNGNPDYFGNYFQIISFPKKENDGQEGASNECQNDSETESGNGIQTEMENEEPETNIADAKIDTSASTGPDDNVVITFGKPAVRGKTIGELRGTPEGKAFYEWIVKSDISFTDERGEQIKAIKRAFA